MSTPPWTSAQRDAAVLRGPHQSSHHHIDFLRNELADMVDRATWLVLPYHTLRHFPNLRVSPMGVVPQAERRPRPIVDYSYSGVNADTIHFAPVEAMQFGRTLQRLITHVVRSNPAYGPIKFFKIDIADGFYRVWLHIDDIPTLAVSIPSFPGEPDLLALPLALPMGWTQSPPAFCAVTETIADLANHRLRRNRSFWPPSHRLEHLANTDPARRIPEHAVHIVSSTALSLPPANPLLAYYPQPLATVDVFVDDFLTAAQGTPRSLTRTRRTLLHSIDTVFRPLSPDDPPHRTEPISVSKLAKGDGSWSTVKTLLGWTVDSTALTITLPPRRLLRLRELLLSIPDTRKRLSLDTWHRLLGELRSMALALPGARGLFSHLQQALHSRQGNRLRLTPAFHQALDDFRWLESHLQERPTRLVELVPTAPTLIGTHDASGYGAGGVWLPHATATPRQQALYALHPRRPAVLAQVRPTQPVPIVWRATLPRSITARLITQVNPTGTINNSELELLGAFLHDDAAVHCFDMRERTMRSSTDNLATLYWYRRGSVTTTSPTATLLHSSVASLPLETRDDFLRDLRAAHTDVTHGVVSSTTTASAAHWALWEQFCASVSVSPSLNQVQDPIPFLQVFAYRYRRGIINPSRRLVRSRTVEGALRSVGQTLAGVGAQDPRVNGQGHIDFRLQRMLASYARDDAPPNRVKPIPVPILRHVMQHSILSDTAYDSACADMICIAFFFLLRPGEYTGTASASQPFLLQDVRFFLGNLALHTLTAPADHLLTATFVTLEFTTQKSGVRGEVIGLGRSGDPNFCPVFATARRVLHLRHAQALPTQPLASYVDPGSLSLRRLTPADLTAHLRFSATLLGPTYGFRPGDVSARSLRAAGAMALLCADVDTDRIRLLGRWQSDQMFRYLHVQAEPMMRHFASRMLQGGNYTLLPNHAVLPP